MKQNEPLIGFLLTVLLLLLWLGFLIHQDEHFAGSLLGGVLAVTGSLFLIIPLLYSGLKRIPVLKRVITERISFATLLTIHIYAGFIGAILVLLHTGHKFHGILASTLTATLLIVVFSGYIGRYLLSRISKEISEKKSILTGLEIQFSLALNEVRSQAEQKEIIGIFSGFFSSLLAPFFLRTTSQLSSVAHAREILQLSDAIADVEYAISTHDFFNRGFSIWLKIHIALSLIFYFLLVLHILGSYHFGIRWF
ncbi:hypothetical protein K2X05_09010 [bacterium]|nr:hypothetical protein [bacterium]